jgi:hypothetical protein
MASSGGGRKKKGAMAPKSSISLREQAATARAGKGSRLQRLNKLSTKAEAAFQKKSTAAFSARKATDIYDDKGMARVGRLEAHQGTAAGRAVRIRKAAEAIRSAKTAQPAATFDSAAYKRNVQAEKDFKRRSRAMKRLTG